MITTILLTVFIYKTYASKVVDDGSIQIGCRFYSIRLSWYLPSGTAREAPGIAGNTYYSHANMIKR